MTDLKTLKEITHPFSATDFGLHEGAIIPNPAAIQEVVDLYNRAGLKMAQITDLRGMASGEVVRIFLREEAKKWIKDFRKKAANNEMIAITGDIEGRTYGSMFIEGKANFMWDIVAFEFMRFFNITEEELK